MTYTTAIVTKAPVGTWSLIPFAIFRVRRKNIPVNVKKSALATYFSVHKGKGIFIGLWITFIKVKYNSLASLAFFGILSPLSAKASVVNSGDYRKGRSKQQSSPATSRLSASTSNLQSCHPGILIKEEGSTGEKAVASCWRCNMMQILPSWYTLKLKLKNSYITKLSIVHLKNIRITEKTSEMWYPPITWALL